MKGKKKRKRPLYISIAALIAAGKTTLARELAKVMDLPVYFEEVDGNTYLKDFYKDPKKYAFGLQIKLLKDRFKQQQKIVWTGEGAVQDRTIYEDSIFCEMLNNDGSIDDRDYDTYCDLFEIMSHSMEKPDLIVFLDVSPQESYDRLKERNRGCEVGVSLEYLTRLHGYYVKWVESISQTHNVIIVDYHTFKTAKELAPEIKKKWDGMKRVHRIQ
ncbi:MAG: deoxynucleoside kinase [Promethearchaeota archaeon]